MDRGYAIFDMDGTLVDSMPYWRRLAGEFLHLKGISPIPRDVLERIRPMTVPEAVALFLREFDLEGTPKRLSLEINALMERHYREDIPLKPGVREYLKALERRGVQMCVASATAGSLMRDCLGRLGVLEHFQFLLSCEEVGAGKNRPDVYLAAAERLGCRAEEAAVYEDALYAAETAGRAGFYVVGVFDESAGEYWAELSRLARETIFDFREERL